MNDNDANLEFEINLTYSALLQATTPDAQRSIFEQMRQLIAKRSPGQVLRMERDRGLTRP